MLSSKPCMHAEDNGVGGLLQRNIEVPQRFFDRQLAHIYASHAAMQAQRGRVSKWQQM